MSNALEQDKAAAKVLGIWHEVAKASWLEKGNVIAGEIIMDNEERW